MLYYIVLSSVQSLQRHLVIDKMGFAEVKYLLFSQMKMLPLEAFKKQLHISPILVKGISVTTISIKIHWNLMG